MAVGREGGSKRRLSQQPRDANLIISKSEIQRAASELQNKNGLKQMLSFLLFKKASKLNKQPPPPRQIHTIEVGQMFYQQMFFQLIELEE